MPTKQLDPNNLGPNEDWHGNNAAFTCPACGKVFIVSQLIDKGIRPCPDCRKSIGHCTGGQDGEAWIERQEN